MNKLGEILKNIKNRLFKNSPPQSISAESQQPTTIPTQIPQPQPINITVPGDNGEDFKMPNRSNNPNNKLTAEDLFDVFDKYKLATESAQVLKHPMQQTYTPEEVERIGKESYNRGENPEFSIGEMEASNDDGTFDYGPMRINDSGIEELLGRSDFWKNAGAKRGINSLEDIKNDTKKNLEAALLTLLDSNYETYQNEMKTQGTQYPDLSGKVNWNRWYAAPLEQKTR